VIYRFKLAQLKIQGAYGVQTLTDYNGETLINKYFYLIFLWKCRWKWHKSSMWFVDSSCIPEKLILQGSGESSQINDALTF
jgi:hypothetical protein